MSGTILYRVKGATHYVTRALLGTNPPGWLAAMRPVETIGEHVFFKEVAG